MAIKTAGMVTGTPDWQLTLMRGPDEHEGQYVEAGSSLEVAIKHLGQAAEWIDQAADEVEGLPAGDRISAFLPEIDSVKDDLSAIMRKLKRGIPA